jgi:hypothetical protein
MPKKSGTRMKGYDARHQRVRRSWKLAVDAGEVACWRCGRLIPPGGVGSCPAILASGRRCGKNHRTWHLGHDDNDRTVYRGPEHPCCNVGAPRRTPPPARRSRIW